jgi:hypothetical protein
MPLSRNRFLGTDAHYFMTMTINHCLPVVTRPETVTTSSGPGAAATRMTTSACTAM